MSKQILLLGILVVFLGGNIQVANAQAGGYKEPVEKPQGNPNGKPAPQESLSDVILNDVMTKLEVMADKHFHEGEYSHIININRIIVQGEPHNQSAYANNAWLLWSSDRSDQAVAFLKQGIQANPKHYGMYDELGMLYAVSLKDYKSAIPYYEQAMKFKPRFFTVHNLARCYEKTGQWEKAIKTWEIALPMPTDGASTTNMVAKRGLARSRAELAKQKK